MGRESLLPGYKQVEAFAPNDEYESEEEVVYVTLDLGTVEPALVPNSSSFRLIGLDTPAPYLQLSGTVFKGQHQSLLGTELLLTDAKDDHPDRTRKPLVHVGTSERRIRFREVELKAKNAEEPHATQQAPVSMRPKGNNNKKDKIPQTVEEVVGSANAEAEPRRRRGGRRPKGESKGKGKGKSKGKEKAIEPDDEAMDIEGDARTPSRRPRGARTALLGSVEDADEDAESVERPATLGNGSRTPGLRSEGPIVQWSSETPQDSESMLMHVDDAHP